MKKHLVIKNPEVAGDDLVSKYITGRNFNMCA